MSKYPTKRKICRQIPYGYKVSKHDNKLLEPIESELDALAIARVYLKTCSCEQVAKWLSAKTGRYISDVGLLKMMRREKKQAEKRYYETRQRKEREARQAARAAQAEAEAKSEATA